MSEYEKYYKENLYPFQDGILAIVKRIDVPFYLTGGTALSRHYSPVRYSDDLDFFVNRDPEFSNWADRLYAEMDIESRRGSFAVLSDRVIKFEDYVQLFLEQQSMHKEGVILKIDLVNDVAAHYGTVEWNDTLGRVDSWRNILSPSVPICMAWLCLRLISSSDLFKKVACLCRFSNKQNKDLSNNVSNPLYHQHKQGTLERSAPIS